MNNDNNNNKNQEEKKPVEGNEQSQVVASNAGPSNVAGPTVPAPIGSIAPVYVVLNVLNMAVTIEVPGAEVQNLGTLKFELFPAAIPVMVPFFTRHSPLRVNITELHSTFVKFGSFKAQFPRVISLGTVPPPTSSAPSVTIPPNTLAVFGYSWFFTKQKKVTHLPWQAIATLRAGGESVIVSMEGKKQHVKSMFVAVTLIGE